MTERVLSQEVSVKIGTLAVAPVHQIDSILQSSPHDLAGYKKLLPRELDPLQQAEQVIIECGSKGLGDGIMQLRPAFAMARRLPRKKFVLTVPPPFATIAYWRRPDNVSLAVDFSPEELFKEGNFYISFGSSLANF
ncbi:hypothetical protein HY214_02540 [Candidatus Roizmanbacteria bacterium]|nr:hypothetical protein [Candidatus Roizmanbacteria bacterium]